MLPEGVVVAWSSRGSARPARRRRPATRSPASNAPFRVRPVPKIGQPRAGGAEIVCPLIRSDSIPCNRSQRIQGTIDVITAAIAAAARLRVRSTDGATMSAALNPASAKTAPSTLTAAAPAARPVAMASMPILACVTHTANRTIALTANAASGMSAMRRRPNGASRRGVPTTNSTAHTPASGPARRLAAQPTTAAMPSVRSMSRMCAEVSSARPEMPSPQAMSEGTSKG